MKAQSKKIDLFDYLYRYGTLLVIVFVTVFFSLSLPHFWTYTNMSDILRSISIVTLIAIGVTISLTVDGFDLSVGSTAGLAAVIAAKLMVIHNYGMVPAIIFPILVGILIGLINAFLIVKIGIPDMLATLSMMFVIKGALTTYTKGTAIYNYMPLPDNGGIAEGLMKENFLYLGQGYILGIPVPVIIMFVAICIIHIFLNHTKYGRFLHVTGGNREAARLSGILVNKYRTIAYILSGAFAALGGIVLAARLGSGEVDAGAAYLMDSVASAYIGFSIMGAGKANVVGTFCGAILIGILLNGLTMLNFPYYAQDIVKGTVLAFALAITYYKKKQ
ncbi:ABC transporter permease [Wukongibacter baidiensis]|uniref:ABC transporter permease n=1 Tax=Wukongibacter baidiensis TaxID=1723361 RepID=UPI003D7FB7ED